jgi:cell division protein FtsI (penicillin-binding protein 3)
MKDDELQVLGARRKMSKREKWKLAITAVIFVSIMALFGLGSYLYVSPRKADGVEVWKERGELTIVPELQSAVDSILNANMTEIGNFLQGQAIVMEVQTGEILAMSGLERNFEGKFQPCKNFAYQQELGALTQTASLLALLEMGIDSSYVVHTGEGVWGVDNGWCLKDHNWRRGGYMDLNLARVLEVSSNIGIGMPIWKFYKGMNRISLMT